MSLQIIYGRSGTGKTNYIFEQISKNINNGKKKYIITPEQFSFTAEKELLQELKKQRGINSSIDTEVLTFNRMAHRVKTQVGGTTQIPLLNSGKAIIVYNIMADKKKELKFLNKSNENIDVMLKQISELKKHSVTLRNLRELMDEIKNKDKYLYEKLNDICKVYDEYEEKIKDGYIDENDALTILYQQFDNTNMFDGCEIYIDEFVGFTKQEYLIIEKLMRVSDKLVITVCTDNLADGTNQDTDLFYTNKKTIKNIIKIANENGITLEKDVILSEKYRFKNEELLHLEKNIYSIPYEVYNEDVQNISLFLANNQYSEIENVAKQIVKLIRKRKYKYKDISIITQNIDMYAYLVKSIFSKYNIPIYIDQKDDLGKNILVKYIVSILEVFSKNWNYDSVFKYIKTDFNNCTADEIYLLEKYALKWNIRGSSWYKQDWNFHDEDEKTVKNINDIRRKIVDPLLKFKNNLTGRKTFKQISENIYNFLIENKIDEKLDEKANELEEIGELNIAAEYATSWKIIMQVLDEIVMIFGDEDTSFDNYMKIIKIGLNNSDLGTIPMLQDQVIVGDIDRSRNHKVKILFIIGLNDGNFPAVNKAEGFLNDDNRGLLKRYGIELAKGTLEKIYEDRFNIYKAFSTAEEKLFLSYCSSSSNGSPLRESILIPKVKRIFPKLIEKSDIINSDLEIINKESTFEELLVNLRKLKETDDINEYWFNVYNVFKEDDKYKIKLENAMKALNYTNKTDKLMSKNIEKMYKEKLKTSVSKLEQYRSCPFSYFIKYGLKLNDKDVYKIEALDTGSFMHEVIDDFFSIIEVRKIDIKNIEDETIQNIIKEIIDKKLKLDKNYIFTVTPKYRNLITRLKRVLYISTKYIVQTLRQSDFEILGHEVEFGERGKYKPIKLSTENGKIVEIVGKIDRIDIAKNVNGKYVRIIDYKSSIKDIDLNKVVAGLQLQLLTYLNETCKVEDFLPAGILYFNLADPNVKSTKNISDEEIENEIKKQFKMQGLILADVNVIKMMDNKIEDIKTSEIIPASIKVNGEISKSKTKSITAEQFKYLQNYTNKIIKEISEEILSGDISIKPYYNIKTQRGKTPCEYCKYKSICRFDVNNKDNNYNYIENLNKEAILEKIK